MTTPSGAPSPQDEIAGHEHLFMFDEQWMGIRCLSCKLGLIDHLESQAARIREMEGALDSSEWWESGHCPLCKRWVLQRDDSERHSDLHKPECFYALLTSPSQPDATR